MNPAFGVPGPEFPVCFDGQCQLATSGTNLLLSRFEGKHLWVGDRAIVIPIDGIKFSPTGLASTTLYYAYVRPDATGFLSTTAYSVDPQTGFYIKSNDRFTRLAGMIRTDASAAFADSATQRFVRSLFNDPGRTFLNSFSTARSTTSTSFVEINSEIRCEFIVWANEIVQISVVGSVSSTSFSTNASANSSIGIDGTTAEDAYSQTWHSSGSQTQGIFVNIHKSGLSEGYHYATMLGLTTSGSTTMAWSGSGTAGSRTTLRGFLKR